MRLVQWWDMPITKSCSLMRTEMTLNYRWRKSKIPKICLNFVNANSDNSLQNVEDIKITEISSKHQPLFEVLSLEVEKRQIGHKNGNMKTASWKNGRFWGIQAKGGAASWKKWEVFGRMVWRRFCCHCFSSKAHWPPTPPVPRRFTPSLPRLDRF